MKKNTIPLVMLLFVFGSLYSCYQQERKCKDFKTGKFSFTQTIDNVKKTSIFTRTGKMQIETFDGKTDTAAVRWVNDCECILQKLHPKNMLEKKAIAMRILTTNKNTYTFEFSYVGESKKQKGIVTKLN
jgi:hypothetical protein